MNSLNDEVLKIDNLYKDWLLAAWYSMKRVISEEIPSMPSDTAFLMEVMGDLSLMIKDTNQSQAISLTVKKWAGVWHCLNVCLNNGLYSNEGQQTSMLQMLSIVAVKLDAAVAMGKAPEEILNPIQHDQVSSKEGLVLLNGDKE